MTSLPSEVVASHFDRAASSYDGRYSTAIDEAENRVLTGFLARAVDEARRGDDYLAVLDLCAGTGLTFDLLARLGAVDAPYCTAVDASPAMLDRLTAKHPHVDAVVADVNDLSSWLPKVAVTPHLITCLFAAEYLDLPDLVDQLRGEFARGTVVILHGLAHDRPWSNNPPARRRVLESGWPDRAQATADALLLGRVIGFNAVPDWLGRRLPARGYVAALVASLGAPWRRHHHYAAVGVL